MNRYNGKHYDICKSKGGYIELAVSPVFGGSTTRTGYGANTLANLRARVAELRGLGFRAGKTRGGLGRTILILRGKDVD